MPTGNGHILINPTDNGYRHRHIKSTSSQHPSTATRIKPSTTSIETTSVSVINKQRQTSNSDSSSLSTAGKWLIGTFVTIVATAVITFGIYKARKYTHKQSNTGSTVVSTYQELKNQQSAAPQFP